jgi:GT2 family glycosyltransferase
MVKFCAVKMDASIIIIAWNSKDVLYTCLAKLKQQVGRQFEIVIIDNGSSDGTLEDIQLIWPSLVFNIRRFEENKGFAVSNNIGAHLAGGKWIILLNADAFPESDWLEQLLHAAEQNPQYSMFSSRQLQYNIPDRLDGSGDAYHISGLAWRNYYNYPSNGYGLEQKEVFSPCAAAALYSREEFLKVGGFDEDYFSYFEDVDLGFRLRLSGAKCLYVPEAVVRHVGSASTGKRSDFSVYYGYRNMIWTFVKNMPFPYFWIFLPIHVSTVLFFFIYLTIRGQGSAISRAIFDALRGLPKALAKRKLIQKDIKIKPQDLLKVMSIGLLEPYREFINRNRS